MHWESGPGREGAPRWRAFLIVNIPTLIEPHFLLQQEESCGCLYIALNNHITSNMDVYSTIFIAERCTFFEETWTVAPQLQNRSTILMDGLR